MSWGKVPFQNINPFFSESKYLRHHFSFVDIQKKNGDVDTF